MISTKTLTNTSSDSGGGTFVQKGLKPGNHKLALRAIKLEKQTYVTTRSESMLMLMLETEPLANFIGFDRVTGDKSKGYYSGQVSRVRASSFNYYDGQNVNGQDVSIADSALRVVVDLCTELGCSSWVTTNDEKYATIEEYVIAFNNEKPFENIFINYCLGGKSFINKKGYQQFDLNLIRGGDGFKSFCGDLSQVVKFDKEKHIYHSKPKTLEPGISTKIVEQPHLKGINEDFKAQQNKLGVVPAVKKAKLTEPEREDFLKSMEEAGQPTETDIVVDDDSNSLPFSLD